ncbi:cysteine-rich receptor-like protein kinase 8 [Tanacetum coccineum]
MVNTTQHTSPSSSTSTMPDDDVNSPYHPLFLHQQDHPRLVLISKKLTGLDNYGSWKRSIMISLNAKNKIKIINVAQGTNAESTSSPSHENDAAMCARMDRLQNQLNQMMLMMQI